MGCQNRYGSIAVGVYGSHQPGTVLPMTEQRTEPGFNYECREPKTWKDKNRWHSLWSFGCRTSGGGELAGLDGASAIGQSLADRDLFGPYSCDGEGTQTMKWIKGLCVDASDVAISGANVMAFRTSDGTPAGITVQSRDDGSYDAPSAYPGVNHFVRAYIAGSPDRGGTTLDTLQPTNIDGT